MEHPCEGGAALDSSPAPEIKTSPGTSTEPDATASPVAPAQARRRRAASYRLEPLDDGRRDPLDHPLHDRPVTDAELRAWRAAWRHLRRLGLEPIAPASVLAAARRDTAT